ncbi:MAG: hypothetical protein JWR26_166 [Pedosphaera sp.]|nr:hypothetical protein [Pedosphaera sp.]
MTVCTLALIVFGGIVISPQSAVGAESRTNDVTAQSIVKDYHYGDVKTAYLLAFLSQVDDKGFHTESALLAIEPITNRWRLVHVFRWPKAENENRRRWNVCAMTHIPYKGIDFYDHKPTEADVEKFLSDTRWDFGPSRGFRLLRGEVYSETWKKAFRYKPKHEFPKPAA